MNEENQIRWSDVEPICLLRMILRNVWMVAASAIIAALAAILVLQWAWTPQYSASATYAVLSKSAGSTLSGYMTSMTLATKYAGMISSDLMKERVVEEVGSEARSGSVRADVLGDANILQITVTAPSARVAFEMIRAVDRRYGELGAYVDSNATLRVLTSPQVPTAPNNGVSIRQRAVLAGAAAAVAMIAFLCWYSIRRDTVQNRSGAKHKVDADVLVEISHEGRAARRKKRSLLITNAGTSFYFQESFARIRTALEREKEGKVILVSSVAPSEGKSTVAANLALAFAQKYKKVLLIDADLRNPTQITLLGKEAAGTMEFTDLLRETALTDELLQAATGVEKETGLMTLMGRKAVRNAGELLSGPIFTEIVSELRRTADYVIIDTPPAGIFSDSSVLTKLADQAILVVRQDVVPAGSINDVVDLFVQSGIKLRGVILNDMRSLGIFRRGSYHRYGYGYGYGYGYNRSYGKHSSKHSSKGKEKV